MPTSQRLVTRLARHLVIRRTVSSTLSNVSSKNYPLAASFLQDSPAVKNDYSHLLENENEYGIAQPMHMGAFDKDQYHAKLVQGRNMETLTTTPAAP